LCIGVVRNDDVDSREWSDTVERDLASRVWSASTMLCPARCIMPRYASASCWLGPVSQCSTLKPATLMKALST
jgi:hypothetical protein